MFIWRVLILLMIIVMLFLSLLVCFVFLLSSFRSHYILIIFFLFSLPFILIFLDTNGDGKVTLEEFVAAARKEDEYPLVRFLL